MTPEAAEEFTAGLGTTMQGGWRLVLWAVKEGVPEALALSTRDWVEQRLGGYVRLPVDARRAAVTELTSEGLSTREAADVLGVSHPTIINDQRAGKDLPPDQGEQPESGKDLPPEPLPEDRAARLARLEEAERVGNTHRRTGDIVKALHTLAVYGKAPEFADFDPDYGCEEFPVLIEELGDGALERIEKAASLFLTRIGDSHAQA